jgi:hypothetical protein
MLWYLVLISTQSFNKYNFGWWVSLINHQKTQLVIKLWTFSKQSSGNLSHINNPNLFDKILSLSFDKNCYTGLKIWTKDYEIKCHVIGNNLRNILGLCCPKLVGWIEFLFLVLFLCAKGVPNSTSLYPISFTQSSPLVTYVGEPKGGHSILT